MPWAGKRAYAQNEGRREPDAGSRTGKKRDLPFHPYGVCKSRITITKQIIWFDITFMAFFTSAIKILQTLVVALGAGLAVWGVINLLEGYGNDNPGAKSQGIKQLMAGGGVALIGTQLVPLLANLFS